MTKLDTRPARCDLTSRECCKLLSGILAGALNTGLPVTAIRGTLVVLRETTKAVHDAASFESAEKALLALNGLPITAVSQLTCALSILGSACGAISEQAEPGALETAVDWIIERGDDYWDALKQETVAHKAIRKALSDV